MTADSPATIDVNTDLGRNGTQGFLYNYGANDLTIKVSASGAVTTEDAILIKAGAVFELDGLDIDQIDVIWSADTSYEYFVN